MSAVRVARPVVRSFRPPYLKEAAAHVRAGGHALVWESRGRVCLVFREPSGDKLEDLGYWSLLDLGQERWRRNTRGPFRGLAVATIAKASIALVKRRADRDAIHLRSTRVMTLDCAKCAACCRDNEVVLEPEDFKRFEKGGRPELAKRPYARKDGDRVVLRLLRSRDCRHLSPDLLCGIYALRPNSCREFPAGSECCLYSREVELGLIDGAAR